MERWRTPIVERRVRMMIQMQCYVGMEFRVSRKVVSQDASAVRSFEVNIIPPAPTELPHVSPARKLCRDATRQPRELKLQRTVLIRFPSTQKHRAFLPIIPTSNRPLLRWITPIWITATWTTDTRVTTCQAWTTDISAI